MMPRPASIAAYASSVSSVGARCIAIIARLKPLFGGGLCSMLLYLRSADGRLGSGSGTGGPGRFFRMPWLVEEPIENGVEHNRRQHTNQEVRDDHHDCRVHHQADVKAVVIED